MTKGDGVQDESHTLSPLYRRVDRLRIVTNKTWAEISTLLDIDRSMFFHIKAGRRKLSEKAVFRLEQAEIEAGISPPNTTAVSDLPASNYQPVGNLPPSKKVKVLELENAIEALKKSQQAMGEGITALEKFARQLKGG